MSDTKVNKRYSPKFKKQGLDAVQDQHLTYSEAARMFDISSASCIRRWTKTLKEEGPEGLVPKTRGPRPKDYTQPPEWKSVDDLLEENINAWAKLLPTQLAWYEQQIRTLRDTGCENTVLITHIPIYAYRQASRAAFLETQILRRYPSRKATPMYIELQSTGTPAVFNTRMCAPIPRMKVPLT